MRQFSIVTTVALLSGLPAHAEGRDYLAVVRTIDIAHPADNAWKRIGDFCYIGELLDVSCAIESGTGNAGTVRVLNGAIVEALVGRTTYSYTYSQPEGPRANTDYHGTLAVEPTGSASSRIVYTLVIDRARLPAATDAAEYQRALEQRFDGALARAKALIDSQN